MEVFDLEVTERKSTGKGPARALRRQGLVPAVVYGPETESIPLTISVLDLDRICQGRETGHAILNLIIKNGGTQNKTAMVKEVQTCPVTSRYLHVDFCEISLGKEVVVKVPVELIGKAKGVESGGLLQRIRYELEVSCLPVDIPGKIEVDVSNLDIGDSLHVEDIAVGEKIKLLYDTNFTVVTIAAPTVVEEEIPEEEFEEAEEPPAEAEGAEETANK